MNRLKKEQLKKYNEFTKNMSEEDKKNYDLLLSLQDKFEKLVYELHDKLFSEEFDFMYDDRCALNRRNNGENPMNEDYIKKVNAKREKLGFLPLSQNGYSQDGNKTLEYCKKLITKEQKYSSCYN